jgi:hypothetical protein
MTGRYRALLIGNSTYPADEHNLQTLKGPVKDIAALNRALIDPGTGLFADVDVTLLPESTSGRAIRALGRFFGTATRDDVLLVYFSGHGKLDQGGRLHLCMQDTESTDLLSTAVSSARINEFADASRARNVVIVLDCCHAGAFRGADLGDAVAGPGRYVLTSCRGTQLANDATVENGTSYFTQHLVDGLIRAMDQDGDGYVTFSDLYAYVDQRLREAGKQIPQRRVDGDGDLPLAKRPQPAFVPPVPPPAGGPPPGSAKGGNGAGTEGGTPAGAGPPPASQRRPNLLVGAAAGAVLAGGAIAALVLLTGGSNGNSGGGQNSSAGTGTGTGTFTASGPWRLNLKDDIQAGDSGCTITLTETHSGQPVALLGSQDSMYGTWMFQIFESGHFRWRVNDIGCLVAPQRGPGKLTGAFARDAGLGGDTDAFAPGHRVAVHVQDYNGGSSCELTLRNPADGQALAFGTATKGSKDTVMLDALGKPKAYLQANGCGIVVRPGH